MTSLREKIETIEVMRELYPKCFYCAASIRRTPLRDLVAVAGRNRLAHVVCQHTDDEAAD